MAPRKLSIGDVRPTNRLVLGTGVETPAVPEWVPTIDVPSARELVEESLDELERLTAFQIELSQRYGLDYRLTWSRSAQITPYDNEIFFLQEDVAFDPAQLARYDHRLLCLTTRVRRRKLSCRTRAARAKASAGRHLSEQG